MRKLAGVCASMSENNTKNVVLVDEIVIIKIKSDVCVGAHDEWNNEANLSRKSAANQYALIDCIVVGDANCATPQ